MARVRRTVNQVVHAREELVAVVARLDEGGQAGLRHRDEQARRQAVPGDVTKREAETAVRHPDVVVVVAANLVDRLEVREHRDPFQTRLGRRKELVLDRPRDRDLALEAFLPGRVEQQALDGVGHTVEGAGEVPDLVTRLRMDPHGEVAPHHGRGGARQTVDVARDRPDEHERDREGDGVDAEDDGDENQEGDPEDAADLIHALGEELPENDLW